VLAVRNFLWLETSMAEDLSAFNSMPFSAYQSRTASTALSNLSRTAAGTFELYVTGQYV